MNTKTLVLLGAGLFGLLILGILIWYMAVTPPPTVAIPETVPTQVAFIEPAPLTISETTQYYTIHTSYPSKTPLEASAGSQANAEAIAAMRTFQEEYISTFKKEGGFESLTQEDIVMFGYDQGRKQELGMKYERFGSAHVVSYLFSVYADTMGAHPNLYFRTFTFDLHTGRKLTLKDLFTSDSNYLEVLSSIARRELPEQIGEYADIEYIQSGTTPEETTFQSFVIDDEALVLIFPPYQVGPYAIGSQKVPIPFAELGAILQAR